MMERRYPSIYDQREDEIALARALRRQAVKDAILAPFAFVVFLAAILAWGIVCAAACDDAEGDAGEVAQTEVAP